MLVLASRRRRRTDDEATTPRTHLYVNIMDGDISHGSRLSGFAGAPDGIASPSPTPKPKRRTSAPSPPRWRFVADAKSTRGYSSEAAGKNISGLSAEELGAKYKPHNYITDEEPTLDIEIGKLDIRERVDTEEVLPVGEFVGFNHRKGEEHVGESLSESHVKDAGEDDPSLVSDNEQTPPPPPPPSLNELDCNENNSRGDSIDDQEKDMHPVAVQSSPRSDDHDDDDDDGEKSLLLVDEEKNKMQTRKKLLVLLLLLLLATVTITLGLLLREGDGQKLDEGLSKQAPVVNDSTNQPSASSSSIQSPSPTATCSEDTTHFSVNMQQNSTGWTLPEVFPYDGTWLLRDACSGKIEMECLPCLGDSQTTSGTAACIPSNNEYIFEVRPSGGIGKCCGFAGSRYEVFYGDTVVVEGDTTKHVTTHGGGDMNNPLHDDWNVEETYFGSRDHPCPTIVPSTRPTKSISPSAMLLSPTLDPTCSNTEKDFNLCIAIDMSGSVCNRVWDNPCEGCEPLFYCYDDGVGRDICCNNFRDMVEFAKSMITSLAALQSNQSYSVVQFATNATLVSLLTSSIETLEVMDKMAYSGGLTNHAAAISACQETLAQSPTGDRKNLLLLITDGDPSLPELAAKEAASQAAAEAKEAGTLIISVMISSLFKPATLDYMREISSHGAVFNVSGFQDLASLQQSLLEEVSCQV